jgi:DNA-binding CsgD family transcriptional regulator/tetratricopeptide (TPR) repeat protein
VAGFQGDVPLVGRAVELEALRTALGRAAEGAPGAVLVAAEAGGGKSRLVRAFLDEDAHDARVVRAQCVDLGGPGLPFLTMVDLVRDVRTRFADDVDVAAVLERHPVLTDLLDLSAPFDESGDETRRLQLFDATATLLAQVGRGHGPTVVVVEDLHWVDSSSADFLRFLVRRLTGERILVVATVRTEGLVTRPAVRALLSELGRLPSVVRLDLAPFDAVEVAELLARVEDRAVDTGYAEQVARLTGGNPFYVQMLAGEGAGGSLDSGLPRALADLLVGRLDALSEDARSVVRAAAIAAQPVPDQLLRQVVGLDDAATDAALRDAVAGGLLVADGAGYAFAHDLLRTAVHDDLLPGERARLHAAYGAALAVGSPRPAEVAHHFTEAHDDASSLQWSVRAAEEAMRVLAPADAVQHWTRALDLWPGVPEAGAVAGMSRGVAAGEAARAGGLAGEMARGVEWATQAIELCDQDDDVVGGVHARTELVRQLIALDATERSVRPAEDAVRLAESGDVDAHTSALAHVMLARALLASRRTDEAVPEAARALDAARAAHAPVLEVDALTTAAFLDEVAGDRDAAVDKLRAALVLSRSEGALAAELRAHYTLASLHYYNGDVGSALTVLDAAMSRVTETGLRWSTSGLELRLLHAVALYVSGDLVGSLQAAQTAQHADQAPPDVAAARLGAISCYAAVALGLPDAGQRVAGLQDSWDLDPQIGLVSGGCEADRLTWLGETRAAVEMIERAQAHLDAMAGEGMYGGLWLSAIALAALADEAAACRQRRDGDGEAAAREQGEVFAGRVERIAAGGHGRPGDLGPEGRAWHARARAEHARLRGESAVEQWQAALDAFGYGHRYEQARCHWRLAEALVSTGDRDAARRHAQEAGSAAAEMQAAPLQAAVAGTVTSARLSASGPGDGGLTAREGEILALVAEGLTNREIGGRLFISEKTVSVHLSNLMAKLNVSSRTEAVTVAHRRGLLDVIGPSSAS